MISNTHSSELFFADPKDWQVILSIQMTLTMKCISVAIDLDQAVGESAAAKTIKQQQQEGEVNEQQQQQQQQPLRRRQNRRQQQRQSEDPKEDYVHKRPDGSPSDSLPGLISFLGYSFCPGNCVYGPWMPYDDYLAMYESPVWVRNIQMQIAISIGRCFFFQNWTWFVKILLSLVYGFMFITISACWNPMMIPDGIWM